MELAHLQTLADGPDAYRTGVSDLLMVTTAAGLRLASVSAAGVILRDPAAGYAVTATAPLPEVSSLGGPLRLSVTNALGAPVLLVSGLPGGIVSAFALDGAGGLVARAELVFDPAGTETFRALVPITLDGGEILATSGRFAPGITLWSLAGDGSVTAEAWLPAGSADEGGDIPALASISAGGATWLLALSAGSPRLDLFQLDAAENTRLSDWVDLADGLAVSDPVHLKIVQAGGRDFAIIGAAGSGSVSVVSIDEGRLQVTDQVNDDLSTRFAGVTVLETLDYEGRAFVLAGGADDGLTLMTLLPTGRLLHLATIADDAVMALDDPAAVSMSVKNGTLTIAVMGEGLSALSVLEAEIGHGRVLAAGPLGGALIGGEGNDQLVGGPASDDLDGGSGEDILVDGAGSDTLRGGDGADVFVFSPDGVTDTVADFDPGVDRLDLSALGRFYTMDAVAIAPIAGGAEITVGDNDEVVRVLSADGASLTADDFGIGDLRDLWHVDVIDLPDAALFLTGTDDADALLGDDGDDTLLGEPERPDFDPFAITVAGLYRAVLGRQPDLPGLAHWIARMRDDGLSPEDAAALFLLSAEFKTRLNPATDEEFVQLIHRNIFRQEPDAGRLAEWVGALEDGTLDRAGLTVTMLGDPGAVSAVAGTALPYTLAGLEADRIDDAFRLTVAMLGRAPGREEALTIARALAQGVPLAELAADMALDGVLAGAMAEADDAEFVNMLYAEILGREPDAEGHAYWTAALQDGAMSRAEVITGFTESREFRDAQAAALTNWVLSLGADDRLEGGAGDDLLLGGAFSDVFVFSPLGEGIDTVSGFEVWDRLDLSAFGFASADEVRARLAEVGPDVVFTHAGTGFVLLDTDLGMLPDSVFML